ncbi:MAG: multiheme c-type cytochrome, partial [Acidobacteriota bacterium]|nr:multiheme c-type cytochrome [Acidobacteriota bacterium]
MPPVSLSTVGISPQAVSQADPRSDYSDYTGAEACKACHLTEYNEWATSRHSRMVQPIKPSEVKASFTPGASL